MRNKYDLLIQEYHSGNLTDQEKLEVELLCNTNPSFNTLFEAYSIVDKKLNQELKEQVSHGFTEGVMNQIATQAVNQPTPKGINKSKYLPFLIAIAGAIAISILSTNVDFSRIQTQLNNPFGAGSLTLQPDNIKWLYYGALTIGCFTFLLFMDRLIMRNKTSLN